MARLLQLLLLIALAYIAWRLLRRALAPPREPESGRPRFEPTARCGRCGTHVPAAELADGLCARCRTPTG
jgi:hypothetical protein